MNQQNLSTSCPGCNGKKLDFDLTMAFQPIVNTSSREVFAQEALVRGLNREPAYEILSQVNDDNRYKFDQTCRLKAVKMAAELKIDSLLSINFLPNAVYNPEQCIQTTLQAALKYDFPIENIIFEITEGEQVDDIAHLRNIIEYYQDTGFLTAIDDFGAGYSGLNLLAEIQPNLLKLDMALIQGIHQDKKRQVIVKGILQVCHDLSIKVIAEGVEHYEELQVLQDLNVELFQGYYFARPAFESLAKVNF